MHNEYICNYPDAYFHAYYLGRACGEYCRCCQASIVTWLHAENDGGSRGRRLIYGNIFFLAKGRKLQVKSET